MSRSAPSRRPAPALGIPRGIAAVVGAAAILAGTLGAACPAAAADASAERKALGELKGAVASRDAEAVEAAARKMAAAGGASAMKTLLGLVAKMPPSEDALYWSLLTGIASFVDRPAFEVLGRTLRGQTKRPIARDLVYSLAKNPSPDAIVALEPLLLDAPDDLRTLVATKISTMHVPQAVDALIALLRKEERPGGEPSALAWIAAEGLTAMTGQEFGPVSVNWEGWWKQNRDRPLRPAGERGGSSVNTGTAVDSLRGDRLRREGFYGVENAPPKAVVVLSAVYTKKTQRDLNNDHIEHVLESMGVPHVVVRREDFADYDLSEAGIVLINCAQYHEFCICPTCKPGGDKNNRLYQCTGCNKHIMFSAKLNEPEIQKLADFAQAGGFLFCEDWVVQELLERAFPDVVAAGVKLKDNTVDVVPGRGLGSHPYLRGIFTPKPIDASFARAAGGTAGGDEDDEWDFERLTRRTVVLGEDGLEIGAVKVKHTWTIDDESYALKVLDSRRVVPLLTSGALQKIAKGDGVVALAFRSGSGAASAIPPGQSRVPRGTPGVVVMVLSHFGKQASREDEFTIQNLLLNVLIDADRARRARLGG